MRVLIFLDFETASACDLKEAGSSRYSEDVTTEILCLCFEDPVSGAVLTWSPAYPKTWHRELTDLAHNPEVLFGAHNAGFEKDIWRNIMVPLYGFPDVPDDRWHCTLSVCAMKVIPQDLDGALSVLGLPGKDMDGSKFTKALSKPNKKTGELDRSHESLLRVSGYCANDVVVERALHKRIGWLQPSERAVWLWDQKVNERGILLDLDYIHQCQQIVEQATAPMQEEFQQITGGLGIGQVQKVMAWITKQGGQRVPDLQKETLKRLLGGDIDDTEDAPLDDYDGTEEEYSTLPLNPAVRRVLEIRQLVGSASIKKLWRMEACVCSDGRARRLLQYHGAGPGRWAGRIIQPQNFPRPTLKDEDDIDPKTGAPRMLGVDKLVDALMTGDYRHVRDTIGPPVHAVVQGLRHAIIAPPDSSLFSGDFEQIEARIVLALAGQHDKVKLFVEKKPHPYASMAGQIYEKPIDKHNDLAEYTIGKNTVLGCGFQMGWKTFRRRYCPLQTEEFAQRVIKVYREEWAPLVPALWRGLEEAGLLTVYSGQPHEYAGVEYRIEGAWLTARLPSGRKLYYFKPTQCRKIMPWSTKDNQDIRDGWYYLALKQGVVKKVYAFGGIQTENVVQALARDLLVDASFKLEANGLPIVLTVHDEDLGETKKSLIDEVAFRQIMCDSPAWARAIGIPVGVESWTGERYRK